MEPENIREFIIDQIVNHTNLTYKILKHNLMISCPFHQESKPSLGIYLGGNPKKGNSGIGIFGCYGCGSKGHWNKLAEKLNIEKLDIEEQNELDILDIELKDLQTVEEKEIYIPPKKIFDWKGSWGGFPEKFLRSIPSFRFFDDSSDTFRILWFVGIDGRKIGHVAARLDDSDILPKYRNAKGSWTKSALFLYDTLPVTDTVVLVEGPRDALRLYYEGIPAMAILGATNWGTQKASLLAKRGIDRVILCMDGDHAGYTATEAIYKDIKEMFDTRIMELPFIEDNELDPGNMPDKYVKILEKMIK